MEEYKCVLCGNEFYGMGNNPKPIKQKGRCCDDCNLKKVIPERLGLFK